MNRLECVICHKGLAQGVSLRRINAKGQPGLWACPRHVQNTDAPRDPELDRIIRIIGEAKP